MMVKRVVNYEIEDCNSQCPYFYQNFYDNEFIWCEILGKRIFEHHTKLIMFDYSRREFPEDCPLPISQNNDLTKNSDNTS